MKKYISGIAAILMAITASSFTMAHKATLHKDSMKWFRITGNIAPTSGVPTADATFINDGESPDPVDGCSGDAVLCVAGFDASQVNGTNHLIGNSQVAQSVDALQDEQ